MITVILVIVLFFIIILIFPILFKLYFSFDPIKNWGMVVIKLWFIKIEFFTFQLRHSGIIIRTKKERKQIEYQFSDPKIKFYEYFTLKLKQKTMVKYLDIYSKIGTEDAFESAVLSAFFNIIYNSLFAYVKTLKPSSKVIINSQTCFNEKVFIVRFYSKISISIFDVVTSFFSAIFQNKRKKV